MSARKLKNGLEEQVRKDATKLIKKKKITCIGKKQDWLEENRKAMAMKWATEPQEEEEEQEDKKKCTREGNIKKGVSEQCWKLKRISRPKASIIRPVDQIWPTWLSTAYLI